MIQKYIDLNKIYLILFIVIVYGCAITKIETIQQTSATLHKQCDKRYFSMPAKDSIVAVLPPYTGHIQIKNTEKSLIFEYLRNVIHNELDVDVIYGDRLDYGLNISLKQLWMDISGNMGEEIVAKIGAGLGAQYVIYIRIMSLSQQEEGEIIVFRNNMQHFFSTILCLRIVKVANYQIHQEIVFARGDSPLSAVKHAIDQAIKRIKALVMIIDNTTKNKFNFYCYGNFYN